MTNDKVNILIVDDLREKFLVLESILAELEENLVYAQSGDEALRRVLESDFAVILLDVNMPGMDGLETASFIRRRKKSAHTPIIFITAYADEINAAQGYGLGAVDYILAPVMPDVLRTKVKVFVDLFRMHNQVKHQAEERVALARAEVARIAAEEATRRSAFLAEATAVLSNSLDPETTARRLAGMVVPILADLAAVTTTDELGRPRRTDVAWIGPGPVVNFHRGHGQVLPRVLGEGVARALATGQMETPAQAEPLAAPPWHGLDVEDRDRSGLPGPFQVVVHLPLSAREHRLGVLCLAMEPSGRRLGPADLALAEDLVGRAAIALDNARLHRNIKEGDRRKNEFLAMLAHELRNPLAPIRNAVQILRLAAGNDLALMQARDIVDRQVTHMARLIDDLLDMSRLSRGKILLRKEPLDLVPLVRAATDDYGSVMAESGLKLEVHLANDALWTTGDPTRLAQVVGNILHNAEKFSEKGGTIAISLHRVGHNEQAELTVRDTGIGMDQSMLTRLFEPFSQADGSLDRRRGGLGLGLALVKGLVELHGGTVQADSDGLGKGTAITIRLPLETMPPTVAPRTTHSEAPQAAYRILVIEDNEDAAESMRMLLTLCGHEVAVAAAGAAGIQAAQESRPNIVLCDIGLPGGMDGYAVARTLRAEPKLGSTRLIALTGYGQEEDQRRCVEAGFDLHLTKPVDFIELQSVLASWPVARGKPSQ
jgi:signal transduction histidine kinase/DNA-binding response OmpR family regulator